MKRLRFVAVALSALGFGACGRDQDAPDASASLTGSLQFVYFTYVLDRSDFKSETAGLAFDGLGEYRSELSGPQSTNHEGITGSGGWDRAGTYRVGLDAGFGLDEFRPNGFPISPDMPHKRYSGGLSRDRLCIVAATNAAGANPSLAIAIRRRPNPEYEIHTGDYHYFSLAHLLAGGEESSYGLARVEISSQSWTRTFTYNREGVIRSLQGVGGRLRVNDDGNLDLAEAGGAINASARTGVATSSSYGSDPRIMIVLKVASGMTNADLRGTYFLGGFIAGDSNVSRTGTIAFDGEGGFTAAFTSNDEGLISTGTETGIYEVASNGGVTLVVDGGPTYTGAARFDGAFGALAGVTAGEPPALLTFTRR